MSEKPRSIFGKEFENFDIVPATNPNEYDVDINKETGIISMTLKEKFNNTGSENDSIKSKEEARRD